MPGFSTQEFLEIDRIKEGIIILKNKGLRIILMVSSLNFALKSEEEQKAIIYQFQNFLNSLDFFCQILIQSRQINITGYLEKLKKIEEKEENPLLKKQTIDYINFIGKLTDRGIIMQKNFYVVIPFSLGEVKTEQGPNLKSSVKMGKITDSEFQRAKNQVWQRAEFVALGLKSCGLDSVPLNSLELTELFWSIYHQKEAEKGYYPDIPPELIK